jgi:hypothetical protein
MSNTADEVTNVVYEDAICGVRRRDDVWGKKRGEGEFAPGCYTFFGNGWEQTLLFQRRPLKLVGSNGVTNEAVVSAVVDRLEAFQQSEFACEENAEAIEFFKKGIAMLESRTKKRVDRGVEGTYEK